MNAILSDLSDKQHEDNQATAAEVLAGIPRIYEQLAAAQDHLAAAMRSRQQTNDAMNRADWSQDRTMCDLIFIDLNRLVACINQLAEGIMAADLADSSLAESRQALSDAWSYLLRVDLLRLAKEPRYAGSYQTAFSFLSYLLSSCFAVVQAKQNLVTAHLRAEQARTKLLADSKTRQLVAVLKAETNQVLTTSGGVGAWFQAGYRYEVIGKSPDGRLVRIDNRRTSMPFTTDYASAMFDIQEVALLPDMTIAGQPRSQAI